MPVYPEIYESGGASLALPWNLTQGEGTTSATKTYEVWNDKGGTHGDAETLEGASLKVTVDDGVLVLDNGVPLLDDLMLRGTVTGVIKTGDPTMPDYISGTVPMGTGQRLLLPDIPKNCAVIVTLKFQIPAGVSPDAVDFSIIPVFDEFSAPIGGSVGELFGSGVIPGYREPGRRRIVRGRNIIADGTANVIVERGTVDYDGTRSYEPRTTHTLNQNDSVPSALTAGQKYIAVFSQQADGDVTVTKGTRGASPSAPAIPADEVYLGQVEVLYQAGGTSAIVQGDVDNAPVRGDFFLEADTGLAVRIGAGVGVSSTDLKQSHENYTVLAVAASSTNRIWRLPDGSFSASTSDTPPVAGADLLGNAVTDGSGITSVEDRRIYADAPMTQRILLLRKDGEVTATGVDLEWDSLQGDLELHRVALEAEAMGNGTGGSLKIDITSRPSGTPLTTAGTSIYTSSGSDDQRPTLAYNATNLRAEVENHDVRRFTTGTRFALDVVGLPTGATVYPSDIRAYLIFRRYR